MLIEVPVGNDFEVYVRELLSNVKDDDYDLHTNSTAKFLFYNFNTFRLIHRLNPLTIRHSQTITNEKAISILQSNNWQYFINQLLHIANGSVNLDDFDLDNDQEFEKYTVIEKTSDNLNYCKQFYEEVFNDIEYFFQKMIKETPNEFLEPLRADLANEIYFTENLKDVESHVELLKIFNRFYFKTGRFPGNYTDLILVPAGKNPAFVKSFDQISPVELNEKFQNGPSYGIAAVHFLASLHIYFGGEKKLSQDVMTELLYNLSYQALDVDNKKVNIKFDEIIKLNKNIKRLIRDVDRSNIETITFENAIDETKDKVETMEQEVVNNIISNKKVEFPRDFKPPMPSSLTEIENDIKRVKAIKRKTDESLNEVYGKITRDLVTEVRNDLVKSVTDYEGETPMEVINNITSSYKQEDSIKKSVRKHVKESIKDKNQQYFKQRKPTSNKKVERRIKPQLKITDIVNRDISRSSSLTSIPLADIEMLSRSASLDSISTMKREYNDEEMISRPPSVSSIRDSINSNIDLSFTQPINNKKKPIKLISKVKPTIDVKPKQALIVEANKTNDKPLTAAAKAVIKNKEIMKHNTKIEKRPTTATTPLARSVLNIIEKTKPKLAPKPKNPPTVSLINSIEKKPMSKKKAAAAKADLKTKQQEAVARWQNKNSDIEMITPVVIGKRKKESPLQSEAKTKKEN